MNSLIYRIWQTLGDAARDLRYWKLARTSYAQAVRFRPDVTGAWVQLGHVSREDGALTEATAAYQAAVDGGSADGRAWLSRMLMDAGCLDDAHKAMSEFKTADLAEWDCAGSAVGEAFLRLADLQREAADRMAPGLEPAAELATCALANARKGHDLCGSYRSRITLERAKQSHTDHCGVSEDAGLPKSIRYMIVGTVGMCNASCIHCPTGKDTTAHVPKGGMPMKLYEKILVGLRDLDMVITDQISFGLFGDGLLDRQVVERATLTKQIFPETELVINTNGAAFDRVQHAPLTELDLIISLHVESLRPKTYNELMAPLRLERVQVKMEQILEAFPGRVNVSVPLSQRNIEEVESLRDFFESRGARRIEFDPLSSRCAKDQSVFESLAFRPQKIACRPSVLDDLVVDNDGTVLMCCQDFQRLEPIGTLAMMSLEEVLLSKKRHLARQRFSADQHDDYTTCSRCFADSRQTIKDLLPELAI